MPDNEVTEEVEGDWFSEANEDMEGSQTEDEGDIGGDEWDPQNAGEVLRGVFLKGVRKRTQYGVGYTVVVKDLDTNVVVKVWCMRTMLRNQLLDASPAPGSPIVFRYNGMQEATPNDFHSYQVRAQKQDPAYWAKLTTPTPEELEEEQLKAEQKATPTVAASGELAPDEAPF